MLSKKDNNYFRGITYYNKSILNEASHYINLFQKVFGKIIKVKNEFYKSNNKKINNFTLFFKNGNIKFISLNNTIYHRYNNNIYLDLLNISNNNLDNILLKEKLIGSIDEEGNININDYYITEF